MDKKYWIDRWKTGEIGFNQSEPHPFLVEGFKHLNLPKGARVFAPLCGKSIDLVWLLNSGYEVIGVELHLQACREFFIENKIAYHEIVKDNFTQLVGEKITLLAGDFFKTSSDDLGKIDAIYDRGSLVALPSIMRSAYAKHLISLTSSSTRYFLITMSYDQSQMQGPPFSVDEKEVKILFESHFNVKEVYGKEMKDDIPAHLQSKGLQTARASLFLLSSK